MPRQTKRPRQQTPKYLRIASALTRKVRDGTFAPGSKVPAEGELSRQFGVSPLTVRQAKLMLVRRGIFYCVRRQGTFVAGDALKPRIAVFWKGDFLRGDAGVGLPLIFSHLEKSVAGSMIFRHLDGQAMSAADLDSLFAEFNPSLAIFPNETPAAEQRCRQAGVPVMGMTTRPEMPHVILNYNQLAMLGMEHCHCMGIDDIAVVSPSDLGRSWREFQRRYRITLPQQWNITHTEHMDSIFWSEAFGYETFHALWKQARRPRGLVVLDDVMFKGMVLAMAKLGVEGGRDIQLVSHINRNSPIFIPAQFARLEVDPARYAAAVRGMAERLLQDPRGRAASVLVEAELIT